MSEITPAMTADEWDSEGDGSGNPAFVASDRCEALIQLSSPGGIRIEACRATLEFFVPADVHKIAALCLHGQEFGFTWEDVDMIDWAEADVDPHHHAAKRIEAVLRSVSARIAALLPPREP